MKTTINLRDDLVHKAMEATGITEKTALVHYGLEELIKRAAYKRLIALGGSDQKATSSARRRKTDGRR